MIGCQAAIKLVGLPNVYFSAAPPFSVSHDLLEFSCCIPIVADTFIRKDNAIDALSEHTFYCEHRSIIMTDPGALSSWWVAPSKLSQFPIFYFTIASY